MNASSLIPLHDVRQPPDVEASRGVRSRPETVNAKPVQELTRWICFVVTAFLLEASPLRAQTVDVGDPGQALTQYRIDTWQTEQGLPLNTVQTLTQTRNGYLWVLERTAEGPIKFVDAKPFVRQEVFASIDPVTGRPAYNPDQTPGINKTVTFCPGLWGGKDWP
ncbi:MAG: hypothetical protein KY432_05010, partial [Acidobacteria bacterium]|nr:hypothetical protein [Acidobacteriota bacterium]